MQREPIMANALDRVKAAEAKYTVPGSFSRCIRSVSTSVVGRQCESGQGSRDFGSPRTPDVRDLAIDPTVVAWRTFSRGPVSGLKPRPKPSCFAVSQNCVSYGHLWQSKRRRLDAAWTWLEMRKQP